MAGIVLSSAVLKLIDMLMSGMDTSSMMFANPSVSLGVVVTALGILILSGLFAGMIPAQIAIKVKPVDALRTE